MTRRQKIVLGVAIAIILILILLLLFWPRDKEPEVVIFEPETTQEPAAAIDINNMIAPLEIRAVPTPTQVTAESVARAFAERFGSFSAESDFANVKDLFPLMTDGFRAQQETAIATAPSSDDYFGVTSSVISMKTVTMNESSATIEMNMQRVEAVGSPTNTSTRYQKLTLQLVLSSGNWLVADASWE